jgi:hypothetical protein
MVKILLKKTPYNTKATTLPPQSATRQMRGTPFIKGDF